MKPMLARTLGPKFTSFPCYVQPKLNGIRALYQSGTFQSRGEKVWKTTFFPHIVEQLRALDLGSTILDGEFYVHNWKLQRINSAVGVNNNEPNADTPSIIFHVFDVVDPARTFLDRYGDLALNMNGKYPANVSLVPTARVKDRPELDAYFHQFINTGYEGLMARPEGCYEFGETPHGTQHRSKTLWKHKSWQDDEFKCIGVTRGVGKASIGIGALILIANPDKPWVLTVNEANWENLFKVGTGFDDPERITFATSPPIGRLIRVRYLELSADGIPLNSSFITVMD